MLHQAEHDRLLGLLGKQKPPRNQKLPVWDREEKVLRFEGRPLKRIKSLSVAKNFVKILDAFHASGWRKIDSPFPVKSHILYDAVESANTNLSRIRFYVCDDGRSINWKRRGPSGQLPVTSVRPL
jgi:hypothetical protein